MKLFFGLKVCFHEKQSHLQTKCLPGLDTAEKNPMECKQVSLANASAFLFPEGCRKQGRGQYKL